MAVNTYTVFGAALVYTGTGSAGALELLGYTEQGVDMDITEAKEEVMTDLMGTKVPQDWQDMGMMARIVTPLIALDTAVLAKVMNKGDRTTFGSVNTPGLVLGVGGYSFSVAIQSGTGSLLYQAPWYFPTCLCRSDGTRLATKANPFRLELVGWPYKSYTATNGKDAVLFARAVP